MAYRRLPNTDNARLTAIVNLFNVMESERGEMINHHKKAIVTFKNNLNKLIDKRQGLVKNRTGLNMEKKKLTMHLRLFVSHFFQVLNFAIERGDLPKKCRVFFRLSENDGVIPSLTKEVNVMMWANNIEHGEQQRIDGGMEQISHPNYKNITTERKILEKLLNRVAVLEKGLGSYQKEIKIERKNIDFFIKQIWNEIEHQFINETVDVKRKKAGQFGVVYVK